MTFKSTAITHSNAQNMRLSEHHHDNLNKDRPIISAHKCFLGTLVSDNIRFMRTFAGVPGQGASNDSGVNENGNYQCFPSLCLRNL